MEVYCITFSNGKRYIGITSRTTEERIEDHVKEAGRNRSSDRLLYRAMRKYTYTFEKIADAETWEELQELEKKFIEEYNTFCGSGKGYNMTLGGDGTAGHTFSRPAEFAQRMSMARMGKGNPMYGRRMTEEAKRKRQETIEKNGTTFNTRSRPVVVIYPDGKKLYFEDAKKAAEHTGISNANKYASGRIKSHTHRATGIKFYYTDEDWGK